MDRILTKGLSLQCSRELNFHSIAEAEAPKVRKKFRTSEGEDLRLQSFCHESCMNSSHKYVWNRVLPIKVHRLSQGLDGYVSDSFSFTKTTLSLAEEETHSITNTTN